MTARSSRARRTQEPFFNHWKRKELGSHTCGKRPHGGASSSASIRRLLGPLEGAPRYPVETVGTPPCVDDFVRAVAPGAPAALKTAAVRWLCEANGWLSGAVYGGIVRHMPLVHCSRELSLGDTMDLLLADNSLSDLQLSMLARAIKEHTNMVWAHESALGDTEGWQAEIMWCWRRLKALAAHPNAGTNTIVTLVVALQAANIRTDAPCLHDAARLIDHEYASTCLALKATVPREQLAKTVTLLRS